MGLTATLNTAQQALATNAALSSLVGRNIAGVNDAGYSRKIANLATNATGSVTLVSVGQAADSALFANMLGAKADAASSQAVSDGLDQLERTVRLTDTATADDTAATTDTSPATRIGALATALQSYAADPSSTPSAQAVVTAAKTLATTLNGATATVQAVRSKADAAIAASVATINDLLGQFQAANTAVVRGKATGADVTDAVDTRSGILQSLSQQIGITTIDMPDGGLSVFTDSGATLFQRSARTVAFTPTRTFSAGTTGNAVTVDGVAVTGASATMPVKGGAIAGQSALRDTLAPAYQDQLDQLAQGLVAAFADTDQTGGSAPAIPGLFTATGGASATAATAPVGIAGRLAVNANVDPSQGGSLARLRDGDIGDPGNGSYNANADGAASYAGHLTALLSRLDAARSFDATSGGSANASIAGYAASSVSWLEAARSGATTTASNSAAVASATASSLSSATGVNLDDELSKMLDLEHSYSASAELMSTVKSMFDSLLAAVR